MNKKASVLIYGLMVGLLIILLALSLAPMVQDFTDEAMNASNLDCSNGSISNFDKAACVGVDLGGFYFIGVLILIGGGFITYKLMF